MQRKWKILLCVLLAAVLLAGAVCGAVYFFPGEVYRLWSRVRFSPDERMPEAVDKRTLELTECTVDDAERMENVRFDQSMMLINPEYRLPEQWNPAVGEYRDSGVWMNECVMDAYASLSAGIRSEFDNALYVMSAYRTAEEQAEVSESEGEAAAEVGASEHQAGLALDVYVAYYAGMGFLDSPEGRYVQDNCWQQGFIIRYPDYGTDVTGIGFEPWHLRYVGQPHAEIIMKNRLTLEEYILGLTPGDFYRHGEYLISRQKPDRLELPCSAEEIVLSEDNTGCLLVTARLSDGAAQ